MNKIKSKNNMTVAYFNDKYLNCGGILKLTEMRAMKQTLDAIGNHFGVSKESVRLWLKDFYGKAYDPRYDRRNAIIDAMIDFAECHNKEEFDEAFKMSEYYGMALEETHYDS